MKQYLASNHHRSRPVAGSMLPMVLGLFFVMLSTAAVCGDEPQIMHRKRQQQETVDVARQLVGTVLDIQMKQFADNGLESLPVFSDIQQMRENIGKVTEDDMQKIIDLLNQAQRANETQQTELLGQARGTAREVVVILMFEQERLRRRLKVAHVQAQLNQLIDQQHKVRSETQSLHTTAEEKRDRETIATLENQRDTHLLFDQLQESLESVQQWDSREGKAASESLEQLGENAVDQLFEQAESDLAKGEIDSADKQQGDIIEQLSGVRDTIEAAQGLQPFDPSSALEKVRGLRQQQQQLQAKTREADSSDQGSLDELSQQQNRIHQQLNELDTQEINSAGGESPLEEAAQAALSAEENLFAGDATEAVQAQQNVMDNLEKLEQLLAAAQPPLDPSDSGEAPNDAQRSEQIQALEQLSENLSEIAEQQDQVLATLDSDPQEAQEQQQQVAEALSSEAQRDSVGEQVQQSVAAAAESAKQASQTLQDQSANSDAARTQAAQQVQQAIAAAQARAAAQLKSAQEASAQANSQTSSPPGQPASGQPGQNSAQQPGQQIKPGSRQGAPPRPTESELTNPQAVSSLRKVGDAKRVDATGEAITGRSYADAPWFARLPPQLREALRMQGRRQPPRGYEQRLQRYFESVDK